jgi:hypothetical protein
LFESLVNRFGEPGYANTPPADRPRRFQLPPKPYQALAIGNQSEHDLVYVEAASIIPGALDQVPAAPEEHQFAQLLSCSLRSPLALNNPNREPIAPVLVAARAELARIATLDEVPVTGRLHVLGLSCPEDLLWAPRERPDWQTYEFGNGSSFTVFAPFAGRRRMSVFGVYNSATADEVTFEVRGYRQLYTTGASGSRHDILSEGSIDPTAPYAVLATNVSLGNDSGSVGSGDIITASAWVEGGFGDQRESFEVIGVVFTNANNRDCWVHLEVND